MRRSMVMGLIGTELMSMRSMATTALVLMALVACNASPPPQAQSDKNAAATNAPDTTQVPVDAPAPAGNPPAVAPAKGDVPAFADRVWRVVESSVVEAGTTYTFLADGTLLIDAPGGTPATGHWDYRDQQLTMIEEGISYPVDIVRLDANRFTIRSNNPGGAVTIVMQSAPGQALPGLP